MKKLGNILWGLVFIVIGVIIAVNSLGIASINVFFKGWWTLFIIIPSFIGLFKDDNKMWSFIWLVVGVVLLLSSQGIINFAIISKLFLPFILIVIGLSILFKGTVSKKTLEKWKVVESDRTDSQEFCATFSGISQNFAGKEFKGANIDSVFGSVSLNLKEAKIEKDQLIKASAIFGGIDITVPANVNVQVKSTPIFGGVSNKVDKKYDENVPTIFVESFCMFGGVNIK